MLLVKNMVYIVENLVLVDKNDENVGTAPKTEVHRKKLRHRAFSVFLTDGKNRTLLQQRALGKYHSAGLWGNSCCGHPRPAEDIASAARRRVHEELGLHVELTWVGKTAYSVDVGNGLTENEITHVFTGQASDVLAPDPDEVSATRWVDITDLSTLIQSSPEEFGSWLGHVAAVFLASHQ